MWIWIWLGILVASLVFEFITSEMVSIWFSLGALVALILAACGVWLEVQWIVFAIISIVCILTLRKISLKFLLKNDNEKITSKEQTVGKTFELLSDINKNNRGTIKINGVEWSVMTADDSEILAGNMVEVLELKGNTYIVKLAKQKSEEKGE